MYHGSESAGVITVVNKGQAESVFDDLSNQKTQLIDILYADEGIIGSLAAMLQLDAEKHEVPEPERPVPRPRIGYGRMDTGLLIDTQAGGPKEQKAAKTPPAADNVDFLNKTGEARILSVLRALDVPKAKGTVLPSSERSLLVHLEGQLQYFNRHVYERIMRRQSGLQPLLHRQDAESGPTYTTDGDAAHHQKAAAHGEDDLVGCSDTPGSAALAFLPTGPGFFLTLRGSKRPFYVPTPDTDLRYTPKQLENVFPSFQLGNWKILAYYPAPVTPAVQSEPGRPVTLFDSMNSLMHRQYEILASCGFPTERLQPILIYRDIAVADV